MAVIVERGFAFPLHAPSQPKGGGFAGGNPGGSSCLLPGEPGLHARDQARFGGAALLPIQLS
jgi:hypothetical protein